MSAAFPSKLVTMANQIATAFDGQRGDAVTETQAHIAAFWPPPMRGEIIRYLADGGEGLSATARAAIGRLAAARDPSP